MFPSEFQSCSCRNFERFPCRCRNFVQYRPSKTDVDAVQDKKNTRAERASEPKVNKKKLESRAHSWQTALDSA